jgi:tetratricopeptide (TPR) repeat protein
MRHALVLALLVATPLVADAKPKKSAGKPSPKAEAKAHMNKAAKAHKAGKFEDALGELQQAYELDPEPKLLFAIAQVQQKLDRCSDAIPNYEKFLEGTKEKGKQAVVKQAISACQTKLAAAQPPADATKEPPKDNPFRTSKPVDPPLAATTQPSPPPVETPPAPVEPTPPPVETAPATPMPLSLDDARSRQNPKPCCGKPWYKDVLGDTLVLAGVAAGAVSIVMYTGARGALDDAESASTLPAYEDLVDKAHDKRLYSVIAGSGAIVLIGAGILHYKLRDKGEIHGVAVSPSRGGGLITWTGGF